jgi:O-antigen/teichoic acid export membrane protein
MTASRCSPGSSFDHPMSKQIKVYRHIVNHLGVAVASKFVPLASIFIYSRYMTTHDYGVLNLFVSYLWIFAIVMSLNLHTGIGRFIYQEGAEFGSFLGTSLIAIGAIYFIAAIVVLLNFDAASTFLGLPYPIVFLMLLVVLGQIFESIFTQISIFHQRSALLLKVISIKAGATFLLSLGLLLMLRSEKYLAVLYADALASFAIVVYVIASIRGSVRWSLQAKHLRFLASYSLPLIPYMLCLTLLSQFDRVLIDQYFGKESVGLYSLVYNIGVLLLTVVTAVLNTFTPTLFDALNKKNYGRILNDSQNIFALAVVVTAGLVLFGQELAAILAPEKYAQAFDLIPIVAIGGLCFVIFQIWVRVITYAQHTAYLSVIAIVATTVNIGLNYWLLPIYGYKIAAVTTVVAYIVMSLLAVVVVNQVVALFKVNILPEIVFIVGLVCLMWVFQTFILQTLVSLPLKFAILALLVLHLKPKLISLIQSRKAA